jgi:hypothetical protein
MTGLAGDGRAGLAKTKPVPVDVRGQVKGGTMTVRAGVILVYVLLLSFAPMALARGGGHSGRLYLLIAQHRELQQFVQHTLQTFLQLLKRLDQRRFKGCAAG